MGADPPIVILLRAWFPEWEPPRGKREWLPCICPFHAETRASASVSLENNAFTCHGCGMKGGVVQLIMRKEGLPFAEAERYAESLLGGSYVPVPSKSARKPGRRVFGQSGIGREGTRKVPPWNR